MPSYDSFFAANQSFCRQVVGCTYKHDVDLYVRMCHAPWLQASSCKPLRAACAKELARLQNVCGLPPDALTLPPAPSAT